MSIVPNELALSTLRSSVETDGKISIESYTNPPVGTSP